MNFFFRLLNKLPKIPGWSSRLHRDDFEEYDHENYDQVIFTSKEEANLYVKKIWGDSPCYSCGRGLLMIDRRIERNGVLPYEDVVFSKQGRHYLFSDNGVFEIANLNGTIISELSFREYGEIIWSIKAQNLAIPPQLPSEKIVTEWIDFLGKNGIQTG